MHSGNHSIINTYMLLNKAMKKRGVTTQQLSERVGINKRTLENYRSGRRQMSLETGLRITDALNADPHELLDGEETQE